MVVDLKMCLRNWGRYCRQDNGGPDSSCANSLYDMMVRNDDDGYGEVTADTVIVPQDYVARPELPEIDEDEALWLDGYILRLDATNRGILCVRYVLMLPCKTPEAKDRLTRAVYELERAINGQRVAYG